MNQKAIGNSHSGIMKHEMMFWNEMYIRGEKEIQKTPK